MIIGICVKTKTTDKRKIFVNICISDKIPPPDDISDTKLFELLNDEVPNYIIPMSICGEKMETDKCNNNLLVSLNIRMICMSHLISICKFVFCFFLQLVHPVQHMMS